MRPGEILAQRKESASSDRRKKISVQHDELARQHSKISAFIILDGVECILYSLVYVAIRDKLGY